MELTVLLDQLTQYLNGVSPIWAALLGLVVLAIKRGWIKLPSWLPGKTEPKTPAPASPDEVFKPLLDRLRERLDKLFSERVQSGADPDDVFAELKEKFK